jgi:hypothetical protein
MTSGAGCNNMRGGQSDERKNEEKLFEEADKIERHTYAHTLSVRGQKAIERERGADTDVSGDTHINT